MDRPAPESRAGERAHAVVVGGGFAGAAAASALAEAGVTVTLIEERATLGGRTSSLKDGVTKQDVDNGQHLFLGSYRDTRAFLKRLGVEDRILFGKSFSIPFINRMGHRSILEPRVFSGRLGLLAGIFAFREMKWRDRISLLWGLGRARFLAPERVRTLTVSRWLTTLRQTPGARRAFWDPLCLATLNEQPDRAAAEALLCVLQQGIFSDGKSRSMGHATLPLNRLWSMELGPYLQRADGRLAARQKATGFRVEGNRVTSVEVAGESFVDAEVFVLATELAAAELIAPAPLREAFAPIQKHDHAPIVAVNLWFKEPPFKEPLVGLLDMDLHWIFNRETLWGPTAAGQISAVISAARPHLGRTSEELIALALADLRRAFPGFQEEPLHASVLWEHQATPSPTPDFIKHRLPVRTPLANFSGRRLGGRGLAPHH
ncbi:MAG: FAD-dependent oxidoreductase [Elusimicrobia bacterium]|nr:FAD-dependent oxidoreductase [Elusimicrobiota bacterium]